MEAKKIEQNQRNEVSDGADAVVARWKRQGWNLQELLAHLGNFLPDNVEWNVNKLSRTNEDKWRVPKSGRLTLYHEHLKHKNP